MKQTFLLWITGLSGSGKTTLGKKVYKIIKKKNRNTIFLDGDVLRFIFNKKVGHSREERFKIAIQISRICKFLVDQDINVICSTMSLFKEVHNFNRKNIKNYFEVFIDCEMNELIRRDKKNLYSKALKGEIKNVVGINLNFDKPEKCHLLVDNTEKDDLDHNVKKILELIDKQ